MKYIIDAHSWIEYLKGSSKGEKINSILSSENEVYSLPITISEVVSKIKREGGNYKLAYESIINNSNIIAPTPKVAKEAGLTHADMRKRMPQFGIVDSIIISTAKEIGAKVLTGDHHFKSFKEAIII